ncbi:LuxR C-terminal-related transcriptional regulator [Algirhabdus cladophorae]|uniref:LuxR C-terminal-related transcriptional regulator n=1 Tax=Algirhabdus cladophorae TaxID=3377108 RepID=UPI003B84B0F3
MSNQAKRVFLIDDHPIVEAGLKLGFGLGDKFVLIGTEASHDRALDRVEALQPDVILSDLVIDGDLDLSCLTQYREIAPDAHLVAFSSLPVDAYAAKCLAAGADRYVPKSTSPHELVEALSAIIEQPPVKLAAVSAQSEAVAAAPLVVDGVSLTPRESEVGRALSQGLTTSEIAMDLNISKKTVAIHRDNLRTKLSCANSNELITLLARSLTASRAK